MTTQNDLKKMAAEAALHYVQEGSIIGVGTGSTVNYFIDALGASGITIKGAVSSSEESTRRLKAQNIEVYELNEVSSLSIYVDGADEINHHLQAIKGGGAALTREKIIAQTTETFVCIADESKYVKALGDFPLPVEVVPMGRSAVARALLKMGGTPKLRDGKTDNGMVILDVADFSINEPVALETAINQIPGVVTCGLFAIRRVDVLLLARPSGVETLK